MDVTSCVVVATDGSDLSVRAVSTGLSLLAPPERLVIAAVVPNVDTMLATGTGFAGGVVSPEALDQMTEAQHREGEQAVTETARAVGVESAEKLVLRGEAGPALCTLASDLLASVLVVGSRGRGAIKRVLLGSVSHFVVQHAPCPVLVSRVDDDTDR